VLDAVCSGVVCRVVHVARRWCQFSRLLVAEVCASAVVMLDAPCSEVVWRVLATHSIRQFPPSLPLPCVTVCHQVSTGLYFGSIYFYFTTSGFLRRNPYILVHISGSNAGYTKFRGSVKGTGYPLHSPVFVFRWNGRVHVNQGGGGRSVQWTTGSRGGRISGSNTGYTTFRGSAKGTGYTLRSPVSPSLPLPWITMCHHTSTGFYRFDTPAA
jgi:hypothetical protein